MFEFPETTHPIRVMVVDDHEVVRRGLVSVLSSFEDIQVVAAACDGEFAIGIAQQIAPDVVLMDIHMPRKDGIEATRRIRCICPNTQVIALTSYSEPDEITAILKAGAISYLSKELTGDELVTAIRCAHAGQSSLAAEAAQVLIQLSARRFLPLPGQNLTSREREVLGLMKQGLSNGQMHVRLSISTSTVKNHVSNILNKLGVTSRTRAVALAVEYKIIA
jgi:two-component system, NarL family, response regulator LiaR